EGEGMVWFGSGGGGDASSRGHGTLAAQGAEGAFGWHSRYRKREHRIERNAGPAWYGCSHVIARSRRCPAGGEVAWSGGNHLLENNDARLRHAVVGAIEFPRRYTQSMGP